jgi:hypothetical protein
MSDTVLLAPADERAHAALAALAAARRALLGLDLAGCSDETLIAVMQQSETDRRQAAAVDHRVVAEVDARGIAAARGLAKTTALLVAMLRIDRGEATARYAAAMDLGPRRTLTGEPLEPIFATVAHACTTGEISPAHARIVTQTVDALPDAVAAERDRQVETFLVEQARLFEPRTLRLIARRLLDTVDPDGTLTSEADRTRRRFLTAHQRPDGSVYGSFDTGPLTGEALLTVLDTLARPLPADPDTGQADPRTAAQRRHDALHQLLMLALRSGSLPACGGVAATILVTMTADQAATDRPRGHRTRRAHPGLVRTHPRR